MLSGQIAIEVVYALPDHQWVQALEVDAQTTVAQAVACSGLYQAFPQLADTTLTLGIYGKVVSPETVLKKDDRIEIYRPLLVNPKQARRHRAEAKPRSKQRPQQAAKTAKNSPKSA